MTELGTRTQFRCDHKPCGKKAEGDLSWPPKEWVCVFSNEGDKQKHFCCWQHATFYSAEQAGTESQLEIAARTEGQDG